MKGDKCSKYWNRVKISRTPKLLLVLLIFTCGYIGIAATFSSPRPMDEALLSVAQKYTVVVNTYRRPDMLARAIDHYGRCRRTDSIRVIWSESEFPPVPEVDADMYSPFTEVIYHIHPENSLNDRFEPLEGLRTESIFSVDDDMMVSCDDLDFAFEVWRNQPRTLVGFMPRTHTLVDGGFFKQWVYNCWWKVWWDGEYSIIITKAAFLHRDFLDLYTFKMPQEIRDYVDDKMNCEDIAMQFLVANETGLPPTYVRGALADLGAFNGLSAKSWNKGGHMAARNDCLNDLVELYGGKMPLVKGHNIAAPASSWWINQPATWLEYFSSDLVLKLTGKEVNQEKLRKAQTAADLENLSEHQLLTSAKTGISSTSMAVLLGMLVTVFSTC